MFQDIEEKLSAAIERQLNAKFGLSLNVVLEQPKQSSFGELAVPVAFQLARQLKRPPEETPLLKQPQVFAINSHSTYLTNLA